MSRALDDISLENKSNLYINILDDVFNIPLNQHEIRSRKIYQAKQIYNNLESEYEKLEFITLFNKKKQRFNLEKMIELEKLHHEIVDRLHVNEYINILDQISNLPPELLNDINYQMDNAWSIFSNLDNPNKQIFIQQLKTLITRNYHSSKSKKLLQIHNEILNKNNKKYFNKYLKYKNKYINLKKK